MSKVTEKQDTAKSSYRIKNWSSYNKSLKHRGQITLFLTDAAIKGWQGNKTGKRGGQFMYSDLAIETVLLLKSVYNLAYRQTEGMLENILEVMGLELGVPSYTQVCAGQKVYRFPHFVFHQKGVWI